MLKRKLSTAIRIIRDEGMGSAWRLFSWQVFKRLARGWGERFGQDTLQTIFRGLSPSRPIFVIESTVDYCFPYRQRPQHLALALAKAGCFCLYVSPRYQHDRFFVARKIDENLVLVDAIERLDDLENPRTILCLSTDDRLTTSDIARLKRRGRLIYDYIDDIDPAISRAQIPEAHIRAHFSILADPDIAVVASAKPLLAQVLRLRSTNFRLITNGVCLEDFKVERGRRRLREDFAKLVDSGRRIVGYYGVMANWLDYALVSALAADHPELAFVFIGPDYDGSARTGLSGPANLYWLPPLPYHEIPAHACWFDVALIPFVINELTLATSPLKLFEYLALGLPVISSPLPECAELPEVLIADGLTDWSRALVQALTVTPEFRERAVAAANLYGWENKAREFLDLSESLVHDNPKHVSERGALFS